MNAELVHVAEELSAEEIMQTVGELATTGVVQASEDSVQVAGSSFSSYL